MFPPGAVATELRSVGDVCLLMPEEAEFLGRAVPKRAREFAAGRACARRALAELGIENFPLKVAANRCPVWPVGVVGSITHTAGLCVSVVGRQGRFLGLGVDSEIVGHVTQDLWPTICTTQEVGWLESLPAPERAAAVTLLFAAKEAVYKCQYPLAQEWLDFHDLVISPADWRSRDSTFSVGSTRALAVSGKTPVPLSGRYRFHEEFVSVGIAIANPAAH